MNDEQSQVITFCELVRKRSSENERAFQSLHRIDSLAQQFSVLRQELDSMVRVIYLLSITDRQYRQALVTSTLSSEKWRKPNSRALVTDKEMVYLANRLQGWTQYVYSFGCAFIHLSNASSIQNEDRLSTIHGLSEQDRSDIISYLRYYHGGPCEDDPMMSEIGLLLPGVFHKISSNLDCYIGYLIEDGMLEEYDIKVGI